MFLIGFLNYALFYFSSDLSLGVECFSIADKNSKMAWPLAKGMNLTISEEISLICSGIRGKKRKKKIIHEGEQKTNVMYIENSDQLGSMKENDKYVKCNRSN